MDNRSYQVTIKGLCFDERRHVLLIREPSGVWDLPGGRMEHGEDFHTTLRRECREEIGIDCEILDDTPYWAWTAKNRDGLWKVVLCFRIVLPHLNVTPSDECTMAEFISVAALATLQISPQIGPLALSLSKAAVSQR